MRSVTAVVAGAAALTGCGGAASASTAPPPPVGDSVVVGDGSICTAYNCKLPNPVPCKAAGGGGSNRLAHASDPTDCTFGIAPNTAILDGSGNARDRITDGQVMINYGQRKQLPDGRSAVYVWAASTAAGAESGWVPESSITESLSTMPTVVLDDPGDGDYAAAYDVTGGDAEIQSRYAGMVLCADTRPCGELPSHYLLRPGNVVNMVYSRPGQGGVSDDTYEVGGPPVVFHRAEGVGLLAVPFYDGQKPAGTAPVGKLTFMYGHIGSRYGWVALDATTAGGR
jgi:hypothetical protein